MSSSLITWATIWNKIQKDCILEDEDWIDESEALGYCNEAIRDAAAIVHGLYEDYFLDYATLTLTAGSDEVSLPTGIYANKIRRIIFENGGIRYPINRMRDWKKFENKSSTDYYAVADRYEYFIVSPTAGAADKILLSPPVRAQDAGNTGKIWFLRTPNEMVNSASVCDIPEFINFVYAHMKANIFPKEGHPRGAEFAAKLMDQKDLLEGTLSAMVPDADNEIEPDLEWYEEMN